MKDAAPLTGIQFPLNSKDKRSTTQAGQAIFAASYNDVNAEFSQELLSEQNWRQNYARFLPVMMKSAARSSHIAEDIAQQGLASCYEQFEFIRYGKSYKLNQAMTLFAQPYFRTAHIQGLAKKNRKAISIQHKGRHLSGDSLRQQIKTWLEKNIIEKSHAVDLLNILSDSNKQDLSGQSFALLGASSEIGPISLLLALGANIIAIGRENPKNWMRLINMARNSPGHLYVPCKQDAQGMSDNQIANLAGADLLIQTPEIASWINSFKSPITLGNYAYLDGSDHVRLTMAMDAIVTRLCEKRNDISLAYLLTPSDVYAVPKAVAINSMNRFHNKSLSNIFKKIVNVVSAGQLFAKSICAQVKDDQGCEFGILDNLVPRQGPNYALAKRIQRWRATVSVKKGMHVSCNVAPTSSTQSVMSNHFFAAATLGSESFGVEVFTPTTANVLMTLQLVSDIRSEESLERGEALFIHGANHGGSWHMGYCFRSVLLPSLIVGMVQKLLPNGNSLDTVKVVNNQQQLA